MHSDGLAALHMLDAVRANVVVASGLTMSLLRRRLRA
jgi:hypothetical protein